MASDAVVWSIQLSRRLVEGCTALSVSLPSNTDSCFRPLCLLGHFNHYFVFRTVLPGTRLEQLPGSYQCLLHYADSLLQRSTEAFPELIEQPPPSECLSGEIQKIYKLCARHIVDKELNTEKAGCLLALIGALRPSGTKHWVAGYQRILDCVSVEFVTELRSCTCKRFAEAAGEGLKLCFAWSLQQGGRQWKAVMLLSPDQALFSKALSLLFSVLEETREEQLHDFSPSTPDSLARSDCKTSY